MPGRKRVNVPKVPASASRNHKPKLGQHFLMDEAAAVRIVDALGALSQSTVLEIGPGRGALTTLLAQRARRLIAIELDRVLAAQLRMNFALAPTVVRLTMAPRVESLRVSEAGFVNFLKLSFGQKRKTLWNNLKSQYQPASLRAALEKTGVKPTVRAEALSLEKSAALFRALSAEGS